MIQEIDKLLSGLRKISEAIQREGPRIVETMAITGKSLVQERIQREGFGAEYSIRQIPAWWLRGKELNAKGKRFLEDPEFNSDKDDLVNWQEFRKVQGLQTDHVDLTYTGRMWAGTTVIDRSSANGRFVARLGGTDREVDKKLGWNSERYPEWFTLNEEEKKEIDAIPERYFDKLIKKHL